MAEEQKSQRVISMFRFRMRDLTPAQSEEYASTAEGLMKIASAMPGFISFRDYTGHDGEMLLVVEFASAEALRPGVIILIIEPPNSAGAASSMPNIRTSTAPWCGNTVTNILGERRVSGSRPIGALFESRPWVCSVRRRPTRVSRAFSVWRRCEHARFTESTSTAYFQA
jgi:hypothetical protein